MPRRSTPSVFTILVFGTCRGIYLLPTMPTDNGASIPSICRAPQEREKRETPFPTTFPAFHLQHPTATFSPLYPFLSPPLLRMHQQQQSSHRPQGPPSGLTRYVSAPSSLLKSVVDSVVGDGGEFSAVGSESMMNRFFSGDSSCLTTSESSCKPSHNCSGSTNGSASAAVDQAGYGGDGCKTVGLERSSSYGMNEMGVGDFAASGSNLKSGGPSLIRHSSSPAGFLSHLMVDNNGFSVTKGVGNFSTQARFDGGQGISSTRMKSQLNFSRQESLSQISEISMSDVGESVTGHNGSDDAAGNIGQSYMSSNFPMGSWDDTNAIVFSQQHSKRMKDINGNVVPGFHGIESQFSLPQTSLEMATVEKLLQMQPDSTPCRIRAKRGCATHPRSIAERDRRTRISEKLKKLQELVPNMDKQTNTAEMLDLAVQHIKTLQGQLQKLKQECSNCTCSGKQAT